MRLSRILQQYPPRTFEKPKPSEKKAEIAHENLEEPKTEVVKVGTAEACIEEASVVICGGRGVAKKDDFKMLEELANILGWQVGVTRPLAEDRKWFHE